MARCENRTDDMLIIRGVNVFPSQIEVALVQLNLTSPHFEIHLSKKEAMDKLLIRVEKKANTYNNNSQLISKIKRYIKDAIGINIDIELVEPYSIHRYTGKSKKVFDQRCNVNGDLLVEY